MRIFASIYEDVWTASGLSCEKQPVVSVVGAGGKSSLIQHFSDCLNQRKIRHIIATTTHMWPMDPGEYGSREGALNAEGKVMPPSEEEWVRIFECGCPVLIEADGSKGLPCKAPQVWEPVLRGETTHVFAVLGASCLGKKIKDICHRPECVADVLACSLEHILDTDDLQKLFMSEYGLYKNVSDHSKYYCVINQVDDDEIFERVRLIKNSMRVENIQDIFFTQLKDRDIYGD